MTIPTVIKPIINDYVGQMQQYLPDLMNGFYLHGSIALGAFEPHYSDVDFLTIISRRCTPNDTTTLADIHQQLAHDYPHLQMDGCYLQHDDWGKLSEAIEPHPHFNEKFYASGNSGNGWVMWWILKHHGVAVVGKDPQVIDFAVDWDVFISDMLNNLNTYWVRFIDDPQKADMLLTDDGIQWAILGVLRQFYTFQRHGIVSKIDAGEYGLKHIPQQWRRIIQEAIRIRQQKETSFYEFEDQRVSDAQAFLDYIIHTCNHQYTK